MWTIIYGITHIVRVHLLVRSEEIVKSIRKEMVMVGIHKTSNTKQGIYVTNVKDIQFVDTVQSTDHIIQAKQLY